MGAHTQKHHLKDRPSEASVGVRAAGGVPAKSGLRLILEQPNHLIDLSWDVPGILSDLVL